MKILVYDVAASSRGALSILNDFYRQAVAFGEEIEWHFVIGTPELEETEHIRVHRFPWAKKSPLHRIFFDNVTVQRLIRRIRPDRVLSLQNVCVARCKLPQMISLHNALPFHRCDGSVLSGTLSALKQRYLNKKVLRSLRRAVRIFVPNEWIFRSCAAVKGVDEAKLRLVKPNLVLPEAGRPNTGLDGDRITFYYPANAEPYKRHDLIYRACLRLRGCERPFKVVLTAQGNETAYIRALRAKCEKDTLPIVFHGGMSREEVYEYYRRSVLVFPSEIETDALPIIEAMTCNAFIIATATDFATCILKDYPNAILVPVGDDAALADAMREVLAGKRQITLCAENEWTAVGPQGELIRAIQND